MNIRIRSTGTAALLIATSAAHAGGSIVVNIDPFGWGAPPPVVYEPPPEYAPPPVVYYGQGHWGDDRERHGRGHDAGRRSDDRGRSDNRGRSDSHDDGDHRR